ncbi:MAG: proline dehydrogenase, partial [Polyangiaceae bacterium]|nr:proline dehydrogenase [Polyangiaceae bacterium]
MDRVERANRVFSLVRAARLLADPETKQGREVRSKLVEQGPLSEQGVDLALRKHLEVDLPSGDCSSLL